MQCSIVDRCSLHTPGRWEVHELMAGPWESRGRHRGRLARSWSAAPGWWAPHHGCTAAPQRPDSGQCLLGGTNLPRWSACESQHQVRANGKSSMRNESGNILNVCCSGRNPSSPCIGARSAMTPAASSSASNRSMALLRDRLAPPANPPSANVRGRLAARAGANSAYR